MTVRTLNPEDEEEVGDRVAPGRVRSLMAPSPSVRRQPDGTVRGPRSRSVMRLHALLHFTVLSPALAIPLLAQDVSPGVAVDSARIVEEAREEQRDFERFRESRIPLSANPGGGGCDERIGRFCIWFGGADEESFPPEPVETSLARADLIGSFYDATFDIRDPWIVGQLVHYLVEDRSLREAETVARQCDLEAAWWCSALLGYVLHVQERYVEALEAFDLALLELPEAEAVRWRTPRFLFAGAGRSLFSEATPEQRDGLWIAFWRFSDPLYLVEGNDRLTEHYARLVEARNQRDAESPQGIDWAEDVEETLIRYGRNTGYSRVRQAGGLGFGGATVQDDRSVVAHHHPGSRGYLFPEAFLASPSEVPPESWITAPRAARSWYAPLYAPDFRALETQVARFRRDDEMLVVGAFGPPPPARDRFLDLAPTREDPRSDPFGGSAPAPTAPPRDALSAPLETESGGPVRTGLFLVPIDGGEAVSVLGEAREGVLSLLAPPGQYVSSLEVLDPRARRAWRARQGVQQVALTRGLVAVSDLLLLRREAPLPESLDEAIPLARPGIRVGLTERFTVAWEVYGLQVEDQVEITLGFTTGRPGFLARIGEFLGILEPDRPVEVSFTDTAPDDVQTLFRAVQLNLPPLEPGDYTLHLRVELPGREPVLANRPIIVED